MKTDEKALKRIVSRLEKAWQNTASEAIKRLYELLDGGMKVDVAVDSLRKEFPGLFTLPEVKPALVEAAAYGYGIVPSVLTAAQMKNWQRDLSKSWQSDGMKLSKRLHGADVKMRNAIIDTIREQMKRNATWTDAARALYDGYNADKVVRVQELPEYLKAVRRATQGSPEMLKEARKAVNNINRLAQKGAPTKALKTAYADMVKAATLGTQEQLQKAIWVAIQEKSRYVADRIIRTEVARAWGDGFIAKIMDDDDVVAVRWKLGSRHPVFDICDMYAKADMYKLGAGIYPKDKLPPYPAHPHCLCRMVEVFVGEVDLTKQKDNIQEAGNEWLKGLSLVQRRRVLGIVGEAQWSTGKDWRKFMNGWQGLKEPETRLKGIAEESSYSHSVGSPVCDHKYINSEAYRRKFDNLSSNKKLNQEVYKRCKAMVTHQSGDYFEDLCIMTADGSKVIGLTSSKERYITRYTDDLDASIKRYKRNELISIHNHGTNLPPTGADFGSVGYRGYKFGVVACHNGKVFYYSVENATAFSPTFYDATVEKFTMKPYNLSRYDAVIKTLEQFSKDYGIEWRELE